MSDNMKSTAIEKMKRLIEYVKAWRESNCIKFDIHNEYYNEIKKLMKYFEKLAVSFPVFYQDVLNTFKGQ